MDKKVISLLKTQCFIDGQWVSSQGGAEMAILNPATGKQIAAVPDGTRADVDRAVQAARTAFYDGRWSRLTPGQRSLALFRLADLLERRAAVVDAVRTEADLRFVNGGGTGSLHTFGADSVVTELAAGSGLYASTLFDGYDDFSPRPAMVEMVPSAGRKLCSIDAVGSRYLSAPTFRSMASVMAIVRGRRMVNVVPRLISEVTSIRPRRASIDLRTTSVPTPRPDTSVIVSAVEKPGRKMML